VGLSCGCCEKFLSWFAGVSGVGAALDASAVPGAAYGCSPVVDPRRLLKIERRAGIMKVVTTRETAHALLDRYPDEDLPALIDLLACRRAADGTDLSAKGIRERNGERLLTPAELERFMSQYGAFIGPADGEG
jgi:hypothetical protein